MSEELSIRLFSPLLTFRLLLCVTCFSLFCGFLVDVFAPVDSQEHADISVPVSLMQTGDVLLLVLDN